ncbi:MAG: DUF4237 domain-containing protein [Clostridium sp.]|nr:DUF4237 domain-containing protein [Clostridium sp.]
MLGGEDGAVKGAWSGLIGGAAGSLFFGGLTRLIGGGKGVKVPEVKGNSIEEINIDIQDRTLKYSLSGEEHYQALKEIFGSENVEWTSRDSLSSADRLRIQTWGDNAPIDELYIKYKDVYQNDLYFNQATGEINWPKDNGFSEYPKDLKLLPGVKIDRYGSDFGTFTSPLGISYEQRALAPGTELKPYSVFEVLKPIEVKAGGIAPWFNQPGGGIQYIMPDIIDELIDSGFLRRIN